MSAEGKADIFAALSAVMGDVQGIGKKSRNQDQNFNFRGIDAVMNAVGPSLREHGVIIVPLAEEMNSESYETRKGTAMRNVTIRIRWRFYGPDGSSIEAVSFGEAADSGDKAVSKAHSVAYRTVLLQALCIPTDEPDPDSSTHERAAAKAPEPPRAPTVPEARARVAAIGKAKNLTLDEIAAEFAIWSQGTKIAEATDVPQLMQFIDHLNAA